MILYHGTNGDFDSFDEAVFGTNPDASPNGALGVWAASERDLASKFGARVLALSVSDGKVARIDVGQMARDHGSARQTEDPVGFFKTMRAQMLVSGYSRIDVVEKDGSVEMSVILDLRSIQSVKEASMSESHAVAEGRGTPVGPITTVVLNKHKDDLAGSVYGGRGSPLGNPFPIDERNGQTRDVVIMRNAERARDDAKLMDLYKSMKGKRLVCFCAPKPCHLDVVGYIAEGIESDPVAAAKRVLAGETLAVYKANIERGALANQSESAVEAKPMFDFSKLRKPLTPEERASDDARRAAEDQKREAAERAAAVKHRRTITLDRDPEFRLQMDGQSSIALFGRDEKGRELRAQFVTPSDYDRRDVERLEASIVNGGKYELGGYFRPHTDRAGKTHFTMVATQMSGEGLALKGSEVSIPFARKVSPAELDEAALRSGRADSALLPFPEPRSFKVVVDRSSVEVSYDGDRHQYVSALGHLVGPDEAGRGNVRLMIDPIMPGSGQSAVAVRDLVQALVTQQSALGRVMEVSGHLLKGDAFSPAGEIAVTRFAGMDVSRMNGEDNGRLGSADFMARNLPVPFLAGRYPSAVSVQEIKVEHRDDAVVIRGHGVARAGHEALDAAATAVSKGLDAAVLRNRDVISDYAVRVDAGMIARLEKERSERLAAVKEVFPIAERTALLVTRQELALGLMASDGSVTPQSRGEEADRMVAAVSAAVSAVVQPEFKRGPDGKSVKSGDVDVGVAGVKALAASFGDANMRNLHLDPEVLNKVVAAAEPAVARRFESIVAEGLSASSERRKDKDLVYGRPQAPARGGNER